jgi:hypothetical protein
MHGHVRNHLIAWLGMSVLAVLNGLARREWIRPHVDFTTAHQISTITLLILLAGYFVLLARRWPLATAKQAWTVGIVWVVLTLAMEFGLGLAGGRTLSVLLARYEFWTGDLWVLIPLAVLVGPFLVWRRRNR